MMFRHLLFIAVLCGAASATAAVAPSIGLKVCNQTSYIIYTAVGWATKKELNVRGWTRIVPGDCATPITEPLRAPAYFIYAHSSRGHSGPARAWGGAVSICARETNFVTRMKLPIRSCPGGEFYRMPFALIDRHGRDTWTNTFTEGAGVKTPKQARRAGINRLLEDLGYHVNVPGDRARDQAIEDFHRRTKLSADANEAELFAALETEAMKATAPAGYTVCNQTEQPLWAAVGLQSGNDIVTHGWWEIAGNACSRIVTAALNTKSVYLFARRKGKLPPAVTGQAKLCIENRTFDRKGTGPCGKGGTEAGFAVTDTRGRSGYVAYIGENGLVPPMNTLRKPR
jgi:uncharacterized membrane protein